MMYILLWIASFAFIFGVGPQELGIPLWVYLLGSWVWTIVLFVLSWRRLVHEDRWE